MKRIVLLSGVADLGYAAILSAAATKEVSLGSVGDRQHCSERYH